MIGSTKFTILSKNSPEYSSDSVQKLFHNYHPDLTENLPTTKKDPHDYYFDGTESFDFKLSK